MYPNNKQNLFPFDYTYPFLKDSSIPINLPSKSNFPDTNPFLTNILQSSDKQFQDFSKSISMDKSVPNTQYSDLLMPSTQASSSSVMSTQNSKFSYTDFFNTQISQKSSLSTYKSEPTPVSSPKLRKKLFNDNPTENFKPYEHTELQEDIDYSNAGLEPSYRRKITEPTSICYDSNLSSILDQIGSRQCSNFSTPSKAERAELSDFNQQTTLQKLGKEEKFKKKCEEVILDEKEDDEENDEESSEQEDSFNPSDTEEISREETKLNENFPNKSNSELQIEAPIIPVSNFIPPIEWPKYIGSFRTLVFNTNNVILKNNEKLSFFASDFKFEVLTGPANKLKKTLDPESVYVNVTNADKQVIGLLQCEDHEMFAFLLKENYILMDGKFLKKNSESWLEIIIDIFLREKAEKNPVVRNLDRNTLNSQERKDEQMFYKYFAENSQQAEKSLHLNLLLDNVSNTCSEDINCKDYHQLLLSQSFLRLFEVFECPIIQNCISYLEAPLIYNEFVEKNYKKFNNKEKIKVEYPFEEPAIEFKKNIEPLPAHLDDDEFAGLDSNLFIPAQIPQHLHTVLHKYQLQALQWMLFREGKVDFDKLLGDYTKFFPLDPTFQIRMFPDGTKFYFNTFTGECTGTIPRDHCKGGMLCDEMGLGKTLMVIGLMLANPYVKQPGSFFFNENNNFLLMGSDPKPLIKAGTLIVLTNSLLCQWQDEIAKHSKNHLSVYIYHDTNKSLRMIPDYDIVLTTYGTIQSEYVRESNLGLKAYHWHRIVLDEAHNIKNPDTYISKALWNMEATNRWILTGTPLQNEPTDMFSLLRFIRHGIWEDINIWKHEVIRKGKEKGKILRAIVKPVFLRREKSFTYDGKEQLVTLPKKHISTIYVTINKREREIYDSVFGKTLAFFNKLQARKRLRLKYKHIFTLLLRLRQICDHPALVFDPEEIESLESLPDAVKKFLFDKEFVDEIMEEAPEGLTVEKIDDIMRKLKQNNLGNCLSCQSMITECAITKCGHMLCCLCMKKYFKLTKTCPVCERELKKKDIFFTSDIPDEVDFSAEQRRAKYTVDPYNPFLKKSEKLQKIIEAILEIRSKSKKVIVCSQFLSMMSLLEKYMRDEGVRYVRMDGGTCVEDRRSLINQFSNQPEITVFLMSLKTGGTGLNLTAANHVIMVDPWWNPAIEAQAIDRVHRIGQNEEVHVLRFICKETIEERILQIYEEKNNMIDDILGSHKKGKRSGLNLENLRKLMKKF